MQDYYLILGLPKTATPAEIDAAFRKLARKYHPDVQPVEEDALALFKSAKEAHEVLSDVEKRREYDRKRSRRQQRDAMRPRDSAGRGHHVFDDLPQPTRTMAGGGEATPCTSPEIDAELRLAPEEASRGGPMEVRIPVRQACLACKGLTRAAGQSCEVCGGDGTVWGSRFLQLRLPPRLRDGTILCIAAHGYSADRNAPPGSFYLVVRVRPCW